MLRRGTIIIFWCGVVLVAAPSHIADCSPDSSGAPPTEAIRQQTLGELRRFHGSPAPDLAKVGDEHIARSVARRYVESQARALCALVWAGDEDACREVEDYLASGRPFRLPEGSVLFAVESDRWPDDAALLVSALEQTRPALAERLRARIFGSRMPAAAAASASSPARSRTAGDLRLPELVALSLKAGADPVRQKEAMHRWLVLSPPAAEGRLTALLRDPGAATNHKCNAAAALARVGRDVAFEWLKAACFGNVGLGGQPALALLEAGPRGEETYFKLAAQHDQDPPYPFGMAVGECPADLFLGYLERLLSIPALSPSAYSRLGRMALPEETLAFLIDARGKGRFDTEKLTDALLSSLRTAPPPGGEARRMAALWADSLQGGSTPRRWRDLAELYLDTGLGARESAARGARRLMDDGSFAATACAVLAVAGTPDDVPAIWQAIHAEPRSDTSARSSDPLFAWVNWRSGSTQSQGWLAIIRLTAASGRIAETAKDAGQHQ